MVCTDTHKECAGLNMTQQREYYENRGTAHVRIYEGRKHIESIDLPDVDPARVICGILDIRSAQECFDSNNGLPEVIPGNRTYMSAPAMVNHCIECLKKVKEGQGEKLVSDGLKYIELMGALVAARSFMNASNQKKYNECFNPPRKDDYNLINVERDGSVILNVEYLAASWLRTTDGTIYDIPECYWYYTSSSAGSPPKEVNYRMKFGLNADGTAYLSFPKKDGNDD